MSKRINSLFPLYLMVLLFALSPLDATAQILRWVDGQGRVHYGDRIPPEYAKQEYALINKQGVTVKTTPAAKTAEQIAAEEHLLKLKAQEDEEVAAAAAKDKILLTTYTSEQDISDIRDRKIKTINEAIAIAAMYREKIKERWEIAIAKAKQLKDAEQPVPEELKRDIAGIRSQDDQYVAFIKTKQREQEDLRAKAALDLKRFKELRVEASTASAQP